MHQCTLLHSIFLISAEKLLTNHTSVEKWQGSTLKALCNHKRKLTKKQVTSYCGPLEWSCMVCHVFIYFQPHQRAAPSTTYYSRYMSPLMDIKCFLFASLFCTYIRDRKPISSSINRADVHTHAHTHTGFKPFIPSTDCRMKWPEDCES